MEEYYPIREERTYYERALKRFNEALDYYAQKEFDLALESLNKALRRVNKAILENQNDNKAHNLLTMIEVQLGLTKKEIRKQNENRISNGL